MNWDYLGLRWGKLAALLARYLLAAMLAGLGALFDDFRTERTLPSIKSRMDLLDTFVDGFLNEIVAHFETA